MPMKVLFVVQGEGRGHLTQAIAMEDLLRRNGHEVVEVLVDKSNSRSLPGFFNRNIKAPIKRFLSPNFLPTPANKRVSLFRSVAYNVTRIHTYIHVIVPAAEIFLTISNLVKAEYIYVPVIGLADGIIDNLYVSSVESETE